MNNVNFEMLIAYLNDELLPEQVAVVKEYLKNTPNAQKELESARQIVDSLANNNLTAPEKNLIERVHAVFRHKAAQSKNRIQHQAKLTFDSWAQPMPLGVRGTPQERQMLFHEEMFDLDIQVMNDRDTDTYTVRGQILGNPTDELTDELEGIRLNLKSTANEIIRRVLTDKYGRFSFTQVDPSDYDLVVELKERDIVINLESLSISG